MMGPMMNMHWRSAESPKKIDLPTKATEERLLPDLVNRIMMPMIRAEVMVACDEGIPCTKAVHQVAQHWDMSEPMENLLKEQILDELLGDSDDETLWESDLEDESVSRSSNSLRGGKSVSFQQSDIVFFDYSDQVNTSALHRFSISSKSFDGESGHKSITLKAAEEEVLEERCEEIVMMLQMPRSSVCWSSSWCHAP